MAELPLPGACGVAISADEGLVAAWTEAEVHIFTLHSLLHDGPQLRQQIWSVTGAVQVRHLVTSLKAATLICMTSHLMGPQLLSFGAWSKLYIDRLLPMASPFHIASSRSACWLPRHARTAKCCLILRLVTKLSGAAGKRIIGCMPLQTRFKQLVRYTSGQAKQQGAAACMSFCSPLD